MTNDPVCTCDVDCLECAANRRTIVNLKEALNVARRDKYCYECEINKQTISELQVLLFERG